VGVCHSRQQGTPAVGGHHRVQDFFAGSGMIHLAMSDPEVLIEQLGRSNRRWKALALTACFALVLVALSAVGAMATQPLAAAAAMRQANEALTRANLELANPGQPR